MTRRPTPTDHDNVAAFNAFQARTSAQAERAVRVLLAAVVGVLLALALVNWFTPCAEATLCSSLGLLALPHRPQWLQRLCRRLHIRVLQARQQQLQGLALQLALDERGADALRLAAVLARTAAVRLQLARLERHAAVDAAVRRTLAQ